jgi:hypothetical protein
MYQFTSCWTTARVTGRLSGRLSPHVTFFVWVRIPIWLLHKHLKKITHQLVTLDRRERQVARLCVPDDWQKYRKRNKKGKKKRKTNVRKWWTVTKIYNWKPLTKRSQGRPKYRWEDNIKQDICQIKIKNWIACVQDRGKWKEVVEKAKTFN